MRIGIDLRCLEEEKISGVGEYALEIVRNLLETDGENEYLIFSNSYKQASQNFSFLDKYPNAELRRFRYPNKLLNFFLWYFKRPGLDRMIGGADIFFAPNINFLAVGKKCKFIVAFHDLSFERFPEFFTAKTRLWHYLFVNPRRIAERADRIIAVSESTKRDLREIYGAGLEKIRVIYHGISDEFKIMDRNDPKLLEIQKKYNLPYKFILYLGNIEPRKNISAVIGAYKIFLSKNPRLAKYKLVFAGNVSPPCRGIIEKENAAVCGYVKREERPHIYNLASLFVYPSFFEGFGLPVLEAMACGTPVVTSDNSSLPEVAGDAAVLVDPNRPAEIADAMEALLSDEKLYDKMKKRGLERSQKFGWKKCARETLNVIASVAKQSRTIQ